MANQTNGLFGIAYLAILEPADVKIRLVEARLLLSERASRIGSILAEQQRAHPIQAFGQMGLLRVEEWFLYIL